MLSFFDENDFEKKDLNERGDADDESKDVKSKNVKYAFCFNCLNFWWSSSALKERWTQNIRNEIELKLKRACKSWIMKEDRSSLKTERETKRRRKKNM